MRRKSNKNYIIINNVVYNNLLFWLIQFFMLVEIQNTDLTIGNENILKNINFNLSKGEMVQLEKTEWKDNFY